MSILIILLFLSTILYTKTIATAFVFNPSLKESSPLIFTHTAGINCWHLFENKIFRHQQPASANKRKKNASSDSSLTSLSFRLNSVFGTVEYSDVLYDDTSTAFDAWEWTSNMGAPAALIATAVLVTLSETRLETIPKKSDKPWIRFMKRLMRLLLMSSFAFEVTSIFVGNMTGSMLLGHGSQPSPKKLVGYGSPLRLLYHHYEFEYLFTQISFLQGLIHWLGAVIVELLLPKPTETMSARRMNKCLASWLVTLVLIIISFYNNHINFYSDYATMLRRFFVLLLKRQRFKPMGLLYIPSFIFSQVLTWQAFVSPPKED
mmetsp:Transcript_34390/g.34971  ORF Transcript_34390/g.34971 Transcript_34390/m.34971 type:complete len:318 (+) Transcript_34390:43-996(+)